MAHSVQKSLIRRLSQLPKYSGRQTSSATIALIETISQAASTLKSATSTKGDNSFGTAQSDLLNACRQLINVVSGPTEILKNMALIDKHNLVSLQVINHYRIANIVPEKGKISFEDIAAECQLPIDILTRILRQAMTYQVFSEPQIGYVAHTTTSREIPKLEPLLTYQLEICLQSSTSVLDWIKFQERGKDSFKEGVTQKGHVAPFQLAHDTNETWWGYAAQKPGLVEGYGRYQAIITKGGPHDVKHVVNGFDWDKLGKAKVVDIGGADGYVGTELTQSYPDLTVIVQDTPGMEKAANERIPDDLKTQVKFEAQSFLEPQPEDKDDADVYLLRHILHDWNDSTGLKILRHLTGCMKPGAKIFVAEQVLSQPGTLDAGTERVMRALDMQMMTQFGGKERTLEDWKTLFHKADERLQLVNCVKIEGSADSFMELQLKEKN